MLEPRNNFLETERVSVMYQPLNFRSVFWTTNLMISTFNDILRVENSKHTSVTLRTELGLMFFSPALWDRIEASRINLLLSELFYRGAAGTSLFE